MKMNVEFQNSKMIKLRDEQSVSYLRGVIVAKCTHLRIQLINN